MEKYKFIPWLRQGIGNEIIEQESLGVITEPSVVERAKVEYTLEVKSENKTTDITKEISLLGPGDILGIDEKQIIRKVPVADSFDFEANNLVFMEFYEEDFLWRYTPAKALDAKLRPWLALIVLKDTEYELIPSKTGLPFITIKSDVNLAHIFPPKDQTWAWAHVHEDEDFSSTPPLSSTDEKILKKPNLVYSRLLCPRKLEKGTQYTAFLIPSFELGRLAGLGLDTSTTKAQLTAWDFNATTTRPKDFPIYYQWRFGTSSLGDFEYLVKVLKPVELSPENGARKMDISNSEFGIKKYPGNQSLGIEPLSIGMEGALCPTDFVPETWIDSDITKDKSKFRKDLLKMVNLQHELNKNYSTTNSNLNANPFFAESVINDPIITPPMYGKWHILKDEIATGLNTWFEELNTDPRYRAAAGIGAQVIRDNQERYMEIVWNQIGEVEAANKLILEAQLAAEASRSLYLNSFSHMKEDKKIQMTAQIHDKVGKTKTGDSIFGDIDKAILPNATFDSGFRKMTRIGSKKIEDKSVISGLVTELNKKDDTSLVFKVAPKFNSPETSVIYTNAGNSGSSSSSAIGYSLVYGTQSAMLEIINTNNQQTTVINKTQTEIALNSAMIELSSLRDLVNKKISVYSGTTSPTPIYDIKPLMKYPVINEPIYNELKKINFNYIIPNVEKLPKNSITLLEPNNKFIESFMVGLNHEMSRELLWREYPTDQRGSYFRQFWDKKDAIHVTDESLKYDIPPIHNWNDKDLGTNMLTNLGAIELVLVIRGDLFRKFPNTIVYAQKALPPQTEGTAGNVKIKAEARQLSTEVDDILFPIMMAELEPEITIIGFSSLNDRENDKNGFTVKSDYKIDANGAVLSGHNNPGWFFVFRERPGNIRFGLDEAVGTLSTSLDEWNDLTWEHIGDNNIAPKMIDVSKSIFSQQPLPTAITTPVKPSFIANLNSATLASVLLQKPNIVAIHADEMLNN